MASMAAINSFVILSFLATFWSSAYCQDIIYGDGDQDSFPEAPIQLVKPDLEHKKLIIVPENIKLLNRITGPVAVVAVVGKFHSGKSFMMNQLMGKSNGFGVGPSVQPKTMGIWMWGRPVKYRLKARNELVNIIFLDTEGFAANNISENYDAKIFAVATLLSSQLIYNSVKIIDQADIDYLELLARRTQLFALRSQMSRKKWTQDFNMDLLSFPPLIWVVQDFVQEYVDQETPTQWLQRLMRSQTRENELYEISLLDIFKSVECHTLFLPAVRKHLLMDLSRASEEDLTIEYREERDALIQRLKEQIIPKEKNRRPITGAELSMLMEILVHAANEGSLADVPSRWTAFVAKLQQGATEDCLSFYEAEMNVLLVDEAKGEAVNADRLDDWNHQTLLRSEELLKHLLHGLEEPLREGLDDLRREIDLRYQKTRDMNDKKIKLKCNQIQHTLEIEAEEILRATKLPTTTELIQKEARVVRDAYLKRIKDELKDLVNPMIIDEHALALKKTLSHIVQSVQLANNEAIVKYLNKLKEESLTLFDNKLAKQRDSQKAIIPSLLKKIIDDTTAETVEKFIHRSKEYKSETVYEGLLALLRQQLAELSVKVQSDNEKVAAAQIKAQVDSLIENYIEQTGPNYIRLPINDSELENRLQKESQRLVKDYESLFGDFQVYSSYKDNLQALVQRAREINIKRRKENVDAFQRVVQAALDRSKKIIELSIARFSTTFSVRQYIRSVCFLNLDDGDSKYWHPDLKAKVTENFMNTDPDIQRIIRSKEGLWSTVFGFIEWILWMFGLIKI